MINIIVFLIYSFMGLVCVLLLWWRETQFRMDLLLFMPTQTIFVLNIVVKARIMAKNQFVVLRVLSM
jgi:hypothetical protein